MLNEVILLTLVNFLVGIVGILLLNNRDPDPQSRRHRIIKYVVYLLLVSVILWSLLVSSPYYFFALACIIVLIGYYEVYKINRNILRFLPPFIGYSFCAALFLYYAFSENTMEKVYVYYVVFVFDGICQIAGQLWGKNYITPKISPKKTLEGLLGGVLFCILIAWFFKDMLVYSLPQLVIITILYCGGAFLGDILASRYKRRMHVKDFSQLIPSHGGILDRFDSFIGASMIWIILKFSGWI